MTRRRRVALRGATLALLLSAILIKPLLSQDRPEFDAVPAVSPIRLDGVLDEESWAAAPGLSALTMVEPDEGVQPSEHTVVKVLTTEKAIYIGIRCYDSDPSQIVRFQTLRDADIDNEDYVKVVIDPFLDGQSGFIFACNAKGARYDALVSNRGESENQNWDAIWDATSTIDSTGWTVEIQIPILSITFSRGLSTWGFNFERRIERKLEVIRWANASRDQWFIQTSKSGLLNNIPEFSYGIGMNLRPSLILDFQRSSSNEKLNTSLEPSLDINQRLGSNTTASLTVNTDFGETEVDTRQTNLTRFPLFFPEKRSFFLEGADIFEFGFGLGRTLIPFFSRRIGLYDGEQVPLIAGGKINGRNGKTSYGGLVTHMGEFSNETDTLERTTLGVVRVKQNVLKESSVGMIATFGDPLDRRESWLGGFDFTYQTTEFQGDKNFLVGAWGLLTNREDLANDKWSAGFKIDYPNDLWDIGVTYMRIGEDFDPSLGFVPRRGVHHLRVGGTYAPRPQWQLVRQMFHQMFLTYYSNLDGRWETYRLFTAPINWRLESGDRIEFNIMPRGEYLDEPFEIVDSVVIKAGEYHFWRFRTEVEFAPKRKLSGQISYWFGSFFDGHLNEVQVRGRWNPTQLLGFELDAVRNIGRMNEGPVDQWLFGLKLRLNFTPDLQLNAYLQYDTITNSIGVNSRLHWIFTPQGEFFLVYNHNVQESLSEWNMDFQQILAKVRYNFRF